MSTWERTRHWKREINRLDRIADAAGRGWLVESCHENTRDLLGPEPTDEDAPGADEWFESWARSIASELDFYEDLGD